ncbi:MAG: hypothetical protein ACXQTW_03750 [Candidatus Methanospirareceae archaeon]
MDKDAVEIIARDAFGNCIYFLRLREWCCKCTIYVPDGHEKIQWTVDNASAGDTIIVSDDGTYTENVDVKKV